MTGNDISIPQADHLRDILDKFKHEAPLESPTPAAGTEAQPGVKPDYETVAVLEDDAWNAFEDLSSDDRKTRGIAAAKLISLKDQLPEVVFKYIEKENELKSNRLAALLLKRQGPNAERAFFSHIKPGIPTKKLGAVLRVTDVFSEKDLLYEKLRQIIPQVYSSSLLQDLERFFFRAPKGKADKAIVSLLDIASDGERVRLLNMAGMAKVKGLLPSIKKWLQRGSRWDPPPTSPKLMAEAARMAHNVEERDKRLVDLLMDLVRPNRFFDMKQKVPEEVRVAALSSLGQIRPTELSPLLEKLLLDPEKRVVAQAQAILSSRKF